MGIIAMLCWIGGLASIIWLALLAFQDDEPIWGVLSLLCGVVAIIYGVRNLDRAKIPLLILLTAIVGNVLVSLAMNSAR
jgi:hypothetical protein